MFLWEVFCELRGKVISRNHKARKGRRKASQESCSPIAADEPQSRAYIMEFTLFWPSIKSIRKLIKVDVMPELFADKVDVRKLAHAYVALALAQDEAKRYVRKHSAQAALLPLLNSLEVTAELLEEVLQNALPEKDPPPAPSITCSNMLM